VLFFVIQGKEGGAVKSDLLQGFYLRDLLVTPLKGQVSGGAEPVHLPPKAMEVLLCLAAESGELVTRETLMEKVWGEGQGSQEALNHAVSEIRRALDDHSDHPQFVQTLPKRGYVLGGQTGVHVAQIGLFENLKQRGVLETAIAYFVLGWLLIQIADIVFAQLLLPPWAGTFVTVLVRRRFSRTYISVIGALAIAAIFVFVYDRNIGLPEAPVAETSSPIEASVLPPILDNTIAVLPFLNVDGSDESQIFSNGLADDVITRLSRVPGLLVSARGDSFTLDPNTPSQRVRERLRVARYLEGSVQLADDQMRIIMQLIDSETGFHVLSRRFDRPLEDYFDIRDEITELTVANVRVTLPPETQAASILSADDPSLDAYVLYRRGVDQSHRPKRISSLMVALDWFDAALTVDPHYSAAYAGKCAVFAQAYVETSNPGYIDKAQTSCASALELNSNLDIVHTALGDLYYETGEYSDAETAYLKALQIVANSVAALTGLGNTYMRQQNSEAAEAWFRKAVGQHPGDWSAYNYLGRFLFRSGRYAEAAEEYRRVVALDNTNPTGYTNLGAANMLAGNFTAAVEALQKAIDLEPQQNTYSNLGMMYYYLGRLDEAISSHRNAVELSPNDHLAWSNLGDAIWVSGDIDEARKVFETAENLATNALQVNPNDPNIQMDLAWISAMLDNSGAARTFIDRARGQAPEDPYVHYIDGLILLRSGETDSALSALELAADKGYSLQMMAAEPHLASIRENPRFRAILDRI
jgi:Flp pilus assembly protein TadD/TolB-like protein/DNA-binding winged helix-turn-helix (wHTH) protein